jgi:hypothetical protein
MIKSQTLYINIDSQNPQTALVRSTTNTSPSTLGSWIAGDTQRFIVYLLDSTGTSSSLSGDPNILVKCAVGGLGEIPYATSSNFKASGSNAWTGSINLDTGSLTAAIGTTDTVNTFFEVELVVTGSTFDSGSHYTVLQAPVVLRNQVIANS